MIERGQYRIVRVDGTESVIASTPTLDDIYKAIGATTVDTVTLGGEVIMIVDDEGMLADRPVNAKATEIARSVRGPNCQPIHGDVALVNDLDFE